MTNTNIMATLDTRRARKDGTFPIILRLSHKRKTIPIPLGITILQKYWDGKRRLVKKNYKGVDSVTRLNNLIIKRKSEVMSVITKLEEQGALAQLSIKKLKERIVDCNEQTLFIAFGAKLVDEMLQAKRIGNARSYQAVLEVLRSYNNGSDLSFEELNYEFLQKWENDHLARGNKINGFTSYMRTIRAIYNRGIKAGIVEKNCYPFDQYKLKSTPTDKRAISVESLKKILEVGLPKDTNLPHYRNLFIASYLLYGMNFIDMAFLRTSSIIDGRLKYRRKKTAKLYDIKVTEQLKEILDYYVSDYTVDRYVFPIIKHIELQSQYNDVTWARERFNKGLKRIAVICGIQENLTSYVARHSFATQAMMQSVPLQAISAMLGHSKLSTTQIYLASLPSDVMDEYSERMKL